MIAIITGANRGIGLQLSKTLLAHEKKPVLIITSRSQQLGEETNQLLISQYPSETQRLFYQPLDINSEESIDGFIAWFTRNFSTLDVLINNAGMTDRRDWDDQWKMPPEKQKEIIQTNFISTVKFTQKILPWLSPNGKILMMSSNLGRLSWQGEPVRNFLRNPQLKLEDLLNKMKEFEEKAAKYEHRELGYSKQIYHVTKAFLNAYTRFVLKSYLVKSQTCFNLHPGWIKTRMGGAEAPQEIEESVVSTLRVLNMGIEESLKLNGEFIDKDGQLLDYE